MQNYRRQQQRATPSKPVEGQSDQKDTSIELVRPLILPSERWRQDPFDSFPILMHPYMNDLLDLCKSTHSQLIASVGELNVLCQDSTVTC